jgi:hypothetical protein
MNLLDLDTIDAFLQRPSELTQQIGDRLHIHNSRQSIFTMEGVDLAVASAVLFLLGLQPGKALFDFKQAISRRPPGGRSVLPRGQGEPAPGCRFGKAVKIADAAFSALAVLARLVQATAAQCEVVAASACNRFA